MLKNGAYTGNGSSPRVRGEHLAGDYRVRRHRIIPARAGQTLRAYSSSSASTDHPRACGANQDKLSQGAVAYGSSPRVRGKLPADGVDPEQIRIIPARAGQTNPCSTARPRATDHPRACGANFFNTTPCRSLTGSSPRVRGKRRYGSIQRSARRIIPARAGQTGRGLRITVRASDHPRACGANSSTTKLHGSGAGSSPRVRGKRRQGRGPGARGRIIPARAGQTHSSCQSTVSWTDHPRACGANPVGFRTSVAGFGSSPRVRGKPPVSKATQTGGRIIPARAGQTPS